MESWGNGNYTEVTDFILLGLTIGFHKISNFEFFERSQYIMELNLDIGEHCYHLLTIYFVVFMSLVVFTLPLFTFEMVDTPSCLYCLK